MALCVAWGITSISAHDMGLILTISTGVLAFITALLARPPAVPIAKGAAATVLVAFAGFGVLHLTADKIAATTAVISIFLGLLFRQNLTPTVSTATPAAVTAPQQKI